MKQAVVIKSKSYGIHLVLNPELEFQELVDAVITKFREAGGFFKDAAIGISFEGRSLEPSQEYELIAAIEAHTGVHIICIMEEEQIKEACVLEQTENFIRRRVMDHAVYHYGSLQPGEELHSDVGLIMIGDVPKGASVTAGGNIMIFGTLEGFAQAGAYGDSAACITALSIDNGQLQIGSILFIPKEQEKGGKSKGGFLRRKKTEERLTPQIARVRNGHVIMEPYTKDLL